MQNFLHFFEKKKRNEKLIIKKKIRTKNRFENKYINTNTCISKKNLYITVMVKFIEIIKDQILIKFINNQQNIFRDVLDNCKNKILNTQ